ncbi:MAG: hypothetical protein HW416_3735 [Chloroflexi bacterium]|nr:hypothetical protein [Chloroflexota bacterium]
MALLPFKVDFSRDSVEDLHQRIDRTRWPNMPFDTGWSAGSNDSVLRALVDYWRHHYDWFAEQARLNELDHCAVEVEGERIHCVRYRSVAGAARPALILLHGWPGSFVEFLDTAELLSTGVDGGPSFDIVVPSLPGYTLSETPKSPGMNTTRIAERMHALMQQLGYERYGAQGGDWGAGIATAMATLFPESVIGLHLNFVTGVPPSGEEMSDEERAYRARIEAFRATGSGYSNIQATRPQTLTYAQTDSPVGLLAWILEKFWAWSDHGDDLWKTFDRDRFLTNVTLYWLTGSIYSAARLYHESPFPRAEATHSRLAAAPPRIEVPTAYASYPGEPWRAPRVVVERRFNLVRFSEQPRGGHFAAMEQPELFARDVAEFFLGLD